MVFRHRSHYNVFPTLGSSTETGPACWPTQTLSTHCLHSHITTFFFHNCQIVERQTLKGVFLAAFLVKVNMKTQECPNGPGDTCSLANGSSRPFSVYLSEKSLVWVGTVITP